MSTACEVHLYGQQDGEADVCTRCGHRRPWATGPHFPDAEVTLIGENGNTGAIMGRVTDALKAVGATPAERTEFRLEMLSGSYADALATVYRWVTVTDTED